VKYTANRHCCVGITAEFDWERHEDIRMQEEMVSDTLPMLVSIGTPKMPLAALLTPHTQQSYPLGDCHHFSTPPRLNAAADRLPSISFGFRISRQQRLGLTSDSQPPPLQRQAINRVAHPVGSCQQA
jgi:hypothetical protein